MTNKNRFLGLMLVAFFAFSACSARSSKSAIENVEQTAPSPSDKKVPHHDPVAEGALHGALAKAWQDLTRDGRYRWAGPDDFRFPDWAKQRYGSDLETGAKLPIQQGHIKHDYESTEAALIIVDTTNQDWNRYGIVIFSEERKRPERAEVKWLYQDRDLSRVHLGWSSGDTLGVIEHHEDGSYSSGFVEWNKKAQKYYCDLRKIK
jgi:hypothetical protein